MCSCEEKDVLLNIRILQEKSFERQDMAKFGHPPLQQGSLALFSIRPIRVSRVRKGIDELC